MTTEQRLERLERQNRRFKAALVVLAVVLCGVVTMAATGEQDRDFDTVTAKRIVVVNSDGKRVVSMRSIVAPIADNRDIGTIAIFSPSTGEPVLMLTDSRGGGAIWTSSPTGQTLVQLQATVEGQGKISTYDSTRQELVSLGSNEDGSGLVQTWADAQRVMRRPLIDPVFVPYLEAQ